MSLQLKNLISQILLDHFGDIVQKVGVSLFQSGRQPVMVISKSCNLPKSQVKNSLRALLKYGLTEYHVTKSDIMEYSLCKMNVLNLLRYPRYLMLIKEKYGNTAESIIEEILQSGSITATCIIFNIVSKSKNDSENSSKIINVRDTLFSLITAKYIVKFTKNNEADPEAPIPPLPEIDIKGILHMLGVGMAKPKDEEIFWKVNMDRFHQDFRDELLITVMTRSIDDCGGELMRLLLQQMYLKTDPWASISTPIPFYEIKDSCRGSLTHPTLFQYLEQYLRLIEESSGGIVTCIDNTSGGQYSLKTEKASELLVWDFICTTVQERLGTKAARIFRLIKAKKFIEEEDIQKNAMLPAKESKQLTYRLLEENFISIQILRKPASSGSIPSKALYLYHIDFNQVVNMMLEITYKALYNAITRREHERFTNKRMIEKQHRVDSIVLGMKLKGEPEENIRDIEETVTPPEKIILQKINTMIAKLSTAEMQLDQTLFILQIYFLYKNKYHVS